MTHSGKTKLLDGAPNEIILEREFNAPRALLLRAMTSPELIQKWLGGKRATVERVDLDFRVGGTYRYQFGGRHAFALHGTYLEIADDRVVQEERMEGMPHASRVTSTFREAGGKTTMRIVIAFETAEIRDMVAKTGMSEGASECYDMLEELLAAQ